MVDFPMPWEPLTTKKERVLKVLPWGELMKSLMYSSSTGRAGAGCALSSLCPVFLTALFMKKPGRSLWMRAWRTSTKMLPVLNKVQPVLTVCAGKALAGCVRAWPLGRTNPWRKLNLPHKDASAECRRKGTIHRFRQFVPNWLWYWRMLDMQNQTGTTAPNLNQYMNLKQIIRHLWTTAW